MAKRIFTSFAIEDKSMRDLFVGQAKHDKVPYEFVDMSVQQPWDNAWKTQCRSRIKSCDGMIVLITKNLKKGHGAIWEIQCAKVESIPVLGVYMKDCTIYDTPDELNGVKKINWTWAGIEEFIDNL